MQGGGVSQSAPLMKTDSFCPVHATRQITAKWGPLFLTSGRLPRVYAPGKNSSEVDMWVSSDGRFQLKLG